MREAIRAAILRLVTERGAGKSICPSEAARLVAGDVDWRALMPEVRNVAAQLQARGDIRITQRGTDIDPAEAKGPVRLSRADPPAR